MVTQNIYAESQSDEIKDKLINININLLDLEIRYKLGINSSDINLETMSVYNQILYYENRLNSLENNQNSKGNWNSTEEMILNAKKKVEALKQKLKLEGDWGKVRLKLDPKEQYQKIDLNYIYGF
ncbi:MAG: hypothetical protein QF399_03365 [Gammaproteobacteria bacterium]|nr:hypothetical protein [Gammaproteobacteria bacterium]